MSALNLLFKTFVNYERTHQLVLYILLQNSSLYKYLFGVDEEVKNVVLEPEKQLFDLSFANKLFVEIKMWSSLESEQINRQKHYLLQHKNDGARGFYFLLGTSWFEYSKKTIEKESEQTATKIGYIELIESLNQVTNVSPDIRELTFTYKDVLQEQKDYLTNTDKFQNKEDCFYHYSRYHRLQEMLKCEFDTDMKTVNNPGGPVFIMSNYDWHQLQFDSLDVGIYYEIVNQKLCIKFNAQTKDKNIKESVRQTIRRACHSLLDVKYPQCLLDVGRIGEYMTVCQLNYDFSDMAKLESSKEILLYIKNIFPSLIELVKNTHL